MTRQDRKIFECAYRMIEKIKKSKYQTLNGEYPKAVRVEIERMKKHCAGQ